MIRRTILNIAFLIGGLLVIALSCQKGTKSSGVVINQDRGDTTDNAPPTVKKLNYIFESATEGYSCFRIPAIIKTKSGTLLAFAEARKDNCNDEGDIDMVVRRSADGGKTWGSLIMVWNDGKNTCGNPVPIIDSETGNIILLMTWNLGADNIGSINDGTSQDTRRVFVTNSTDDGVTWASAKEITDDVKLKNWGWYATGPCHGIQISKGAYAGRMIVPCDNIERITKKGSSHVIYSDDSGATWQLGGIIPNIKGNESTVAELANGNLMLNMRSSNYRLVSTSSDGGMSWTNAELDYNLPDPTCQGSLLSYADGGETKLYFSNPASNTSRTNMTLRQSIDGGGTWPKTLRVYDGPSAYSDLVMTDATHVGILYEAGSLRPYDGIVFENISIDELK